MTRRKKPKEKYQWFLSTNAVKDVSFGTMDDYNRAIDRWRKSNKTRKIKVGMKRETFFRRSIDLRRPVDLDHNKPDFQEMSYSEIQKWKFDKYTGWYQEHANEV